MSAMAPRVLPAAEYVTEAVARIRAAKHRVTLFTMIITHDASTSALIDALCAAAERGVEVRVAGDIFTLGVMTFETHGHPWDNTGIRATRRMRRQLNDSGVKFSWVGQLGPLLYARRTHLKWCIIDDDVFCFGGVNLYKNGINNIDYMLLVHDKALATRLDSEHLRLHRADRAGKWYRCFSFPCSVGQVLMDGGTFGSSIIYQRARTLASQAEKIVYVSQYQPSGRLAKILRTKQAPLYYNRWQNAYGMNKILLRLSAIFSQQHTLFTRSGYLHAKFIIFTMSDGHKVALSGTHNFVHGGVLLGTREIALETQDTEVIAQLEAYFEKYIG